MDGESHGVLLIIFLGANFWSFFRIPKSASIVVSWSSEKRMLNCVCYGPMEEDDTLISVIGIFSKAIINRKYFFTR